MRAVSEDKSQQGPPQCRQFTSGFVVYMYNFLSARWGWAVPVTALPVASTSIQNSRLLHAATLLRFMRGVNENPYLDEQLRPQVNVVLVTL